MAVAYAFRVAKPTVSWVWEEFDADVRQVKLETCAEWSRTTVGLVKLVTTEENWVEESDATTGSAVPFSGKRIFCRSLMCRFYRYDIIQR